MIIIMVNHYCILTSAIKYIHKTDTSVHGDVRINVIVSLTNSGISRE